MKQIDIDSFNLHKNAGVTPYIVDPKVTGVGFPAIRTTNYDRGGENGGFVSNQLYGNRTIGISGIVSGANAIAYEVKRRTIEANMALLKDINGFNLPHLFKFTTLDDLAVQINGYIHEFVLDDENPTNAHYLLQVLCPDPLFESQILQGSTVSRPTGGGTLVPFVVPVILGAEVGGAISVVNSGNADANPILTFSGPLTNPVIQNLTKGLYMQLNLTVTAGQQVTIDMKNHTILLGTQSILQYKSLDSEFWTLAPGTNIIAFTTSNAADTGNALVQWRDTYIGI